MRLGKDVGVTTNIRPAGIYSGLEAFSPLINDIIRSGFDIVFVRDIAGGVLCSEKVKATGEHGKEAYEYEYYNEEIVCDTAKIAFQLAAQRSRKVTSLDKANVLESSRLWRKTITRAAERFQDIQLDHCYIDTAAMRIIAAPSQFDVVVTANLFGDIISDEGTQLCGVPGLYASAELAIDRRGIYTPTQLHFVDESIIGKQEVNPIGMIAAAALMLRYSFELEEEAKEIERAIRKVVLSGYATKDFHAPGKQLVTTKEIGELITCQIRNRRG